MKPTAHQTDTIHTFSLYKFNRTPNISTWYSTGILYEVYHTPNTSTEHEDYMKLTFHKTGTVCVVYMKFTIHQTRVQ